MKSWLSLLFISIIMGSAVSAYSNSVLSQSAAPEQNVRPQIMVLGTHHFTGGGYDYVNPQVDNYLSPQRQREILDVVERLSSFKPTKVALEIHPDDEEAFNKIYNTYRNGEHTLGVSERQQIGMRLAAMFEHPSIYAVDFKNGGMDIGGMFQLGEQTGQSDILEYLSKLRETISQQDAALNKKNVTVRQRLLRENSDEVAKAHNVYLTLAQIGDASNMLGAEEMGKWWSRNLHIFANISYIAEPDDRILVIYGSGHKFLLDQFIADSHEFELVDPQGFLEDKN